MKAPSVDGPDARKPIYDLNGNLTQFVCMWQMGLFLVGFAQVLRSGKYTGDLAIANRIMVSCSETMARFGFFFQDGIPHTVDDIMWNGGQEPPGGMRYPSPHILAHPWAQATGTWTFAGALVARDYLPRMSAEWLMLNAYIEAITGGGNEAGDIKSAEWWAITDTIRRPIPPATL